MIQDSINLSRNVGSLSPKALALFCLLIPKYNAYGKMNGDPFYIKGEVCRHVNFLNLKSISEALEEISKKTNVKWWKDKSGDHWIHAIEFEEHQPGLRKDRRGLDKLPDFQAKSGSSSGIVQEPSTPEEEGEEEGELELEGEEEKRSRSRPKGPKLPDEDFWEMLRKNQAYAHINFEIENGKMDAWLSLPRNKHRKKTSRFVLDWLNRIDRPVGSPGNNSKSAIDTWLEGRKKNA